MNRKTLIAAAAAILSIAAIQTSGAQAAGPSAALAGAKPVATADATITQARHRGGRRFRRRFRRFHRFHHWRRFGHYRGCGYYWRKWQYTGFHFWKKRYFACKFGY